MLAHKTLLLREEAQKVDVLESVILTVLEKLLDFALFMKAQHKRRKLLRSYTEAPRIFPLAPLALA